MTIVHFGLFSDQVQVAHGHQGTWGAEEGYRGDLVSTGLWGMGLGKDTPALAGSSQLNSRGHHPPCFCDSAEFQPLVRVYQAWLLERSKGWFCFGGHFLRPLFGGSPSAPMSYETLNPDSRALYPP